MLKTVFTSSHNHGRFLAEAIESVLSQTNGEFEYLLFDDGSTDSTWPIIEQYAAIDDRIRPFRLDKQPNVGVVINRSIREMKGGVWLWCPADDKWDRMLLDQKEQVARCYPDDVLYNDWELIDEHGNSLGHRAPRTYDPEEFKKVVWKGSPLGFTGIWIPRSAFDKAGLFPEHLGFSEDFYWMICAAMRGVVFRHVPMALHKKRRHPSTLTSKNSQQMEDQKQRIWQELRRIL